MKNFLCIPIFLLTASLFFGDIRGLNVESAMSQGISIGKQYLFLIAIDKYSDWPNLKNPVEDVHEIRDILKSRYRIDQVVELYNSDATKANILRNFSELQKNLQPQDSLLVLYAGHGYFDHKVTNSGFWVPSNGGTDIFEQANWIPNSQIRGIISNFNAAHILLISDSCFSGDILNEMRGEEIGGKPDASNAAKAYALTSRQVITSGSEESVPDNSEFAQQLKMALQKNTDAYLDPVTLYAQIKKGVNATLPLLGNLKETGHQEGASFFLFLKPTPGEEAKNAAILSPQPGTTGKQDSSENRFSFGIEAGVLIPLLDAEKILGFGFGSSFSIGYQFALPFGYVGFSALSGFQNNALRDEIPNHYTIFALPLGLNIMWDIVLLSIFQIRLELGGGEMINILSYQSGDMPTVYAPYVTGMAGSDILIDSRLAFGAYIRCSILFFVNVFSIDFVPGLRVSYSTR